MTFDTLLPQSFRRLGATLVASALVVGLAACTDASSPNHLAREDARYALEVLDRATQQGFAPGSFHVRELHQAVDRHDRNASALLRTALLEYARAEHGLAIPAKARPAAWGEGAPKYDPAPELDAALQQHRFKAWIDGLPPQSALYRALQQGYAASLNQPAADPAALTTLRANLERLRWLPRDEPATRVDVNIASATMIYVEGGQPRLTMKTASGKPGDETPMLTSKIDHIVLNPPWNVPDGIANDEIRPKGEDYLARNNFVTDEGGHLKQLPGPGSALGLVKFDFDNPFSVYLHDTPSKGAFDKGVRAVSHGCVRLERAIDLANILLGAEGWSPQKVQEVIASGETTTVKLSRPTAVRLMYLTAVPDATGRIVYQPDLYGWDAPVVQLLDRSTLGTPA
jgi:murein L,D-transpeptidase YcbB/YkuD